MIVRVILIIYNFLLAFLFVSAIWKSLVHSKPIFPVDRPVNWCEFNDWFLGDGKIAFGNIDDVNIAGKS